MKYLRIIIEPIKIKGDPDDHETLNSDILEKVMAMCEAETLAWDIDWDAEEDDEDQ